MSFDGVFLHHVIKEYTHPLVGSRCEDFFYFDQQFYIQLYHQKHKFTLVIDLNANQNRLFYTDELIKHEHKNPFLLALKQSLTRSVITKISQHGSDRVLIVDFLKHDPFKGDLSYQLVIEFMGKHANMILISDHIIIDAFKRRVSADSRSVLPGIHFEFFPSSKLSLDHLNIPFDHEATYYIQTFEGLSIQTVYHMITHQIHPFHIQVIPTLYNQQKYIFPYKNGQTYNTLNQLMAIESNQLSTKEDRFLVHILEKLEQKRLALQHDFENQHSKLIYKDYIQRIYQEFDLNAKVSILDTIELDVTKTLKEQAQLFSEQYTKAKRALPIISEQLSKTESLIELVHDLHHEFMNQSLSKDDVNTILHQSQLIRIQGIAKKSKKLTHHQCTLNQSVIMYGKNAIQNNYVTHYLADKNDLFIHVKNASGAHVILKQGYSDEAFNYALTLALYHSKLKLGGKGEVMYTKKSNISKLPGVFGSMVRVKQFQSKIVTLPDNFKELCE